MKIIVLGNESSWNELTENNNDILWSRAGSITSFYTNTDADAFFNLNADASQQDYNKISAPVFINSVAKTLREINARQNVIRINAWHGFLKRNAWEVAGNITENVSTVLNVFKKKIIVTPDEPGFISARIISMIINEAFFAKGENVSTENEIDIAMKLGTNYPFGPFEWAREIGIKNIYELLSCLGKNDTRYIPAPSLEQKAKV